MGDSDSDDGKDDGCSTFGKLDRGDVDVGEEVGGMMDELLSDRGGSAGCSGNIGASCSGWAVLSSMLIILIVVFILLFVNR